MKIIISTLTNAPVSLTVLLSLQKIRRIVTKISWNSFLFLTPLIILFSCGNEPGSTTVDTAIHDKEIRKGNNVISIDSKTMRTSTNNGYVIAYKAACNKINQPGNKFTSEDSVTLNKTGDGIYITQ